METVKKKRGRPPKHKAMEFEGMTYEGAINNALDKEVAADLDKSLADKDESQLSDDERKYLKRKREKKSYTLNVRFTESEMQDILAKCEQYGYKNKTEYIRDCVRARVDLTPDRTEIAETNRLMKRIGANINQILVRLYSTGHIYENEMKKEGKSWKDKLCNMLREIISYSRSFEDFLKNCTDSGIEYVYTPQNKVKLKFKLSGEGQQRFTRADTLGDEFEPSAITETIETAQKKAAAEEAMEKFLAARRARQQAELALLNRASAKPAEPTPTSTTPTIAQPTAPKPIESKAPEEDPWKAIRGMGRADEIIADLESGGVMSFSELSGFFFNTPHSDDHTTELADLKKKFTAIDTLIEKMKHHDELEPVYKEYQDKSGWLQSRFKKKNSATIEDYEQTVKYIREHIKRYAVDGKPPTMLDLLEKSNKLKSKWNRLNVEHTAFLTKRETAKKYTRQVRQYINEQQMKREREKYRQKKLTQQRKKDTLE